MKLVYLFIYLVFCAEKTMQMLLNSDFKTFNINPLDKDSKKYNREEMNKLIQSQIKNSNEWTALINEQKIKPLF